MSDSAITTNGTSWPILPLGEIAEVKLGKMLDKAKQRTGRRLPYLRNINVRWGSVDTTDLLEMNFEDDELDRFGLNEGDVLVCEGGEPGRAAVWNNCIPNVKYQKAIHRIRFKQPYEPRLLVYLLELLAKTGRLERRFTGSTIKHFTREAIVQLPIPVPPLEEQGHIVAEIEKQLTRLDAGVTSLKRVQVALKRYRAAVFKAACENAGWEKITIRDSIQIIDYRGRTPPFSKIGIPHLRSSNIRCGRILWEDVAHVSEETYNAYMTRGLPQEGDVLFTTEAPMGEVAPAPNEKFSVAQRIMILRPRPDVFDSRFLMIQLMSPQFQARLRHTGTGSTVTGVSSRNFQPIELALPQLSEQKRIVAEVERRLSVVEELEAIVSANLQRAKGLRQSILRWAFDG